jgi:hypothetical protein
MTAQTTTTATDSLTASGTNRPSGLSDRALATRSAWAIRQMPENSPEQRAALRQHSLRFASNLGRSCSI